MDIKKYQATALDKIERLENELTAACKEIERLVALNDKLVINEKKLIEEGYESQKESKRLEKENAHLRQELAHYKQIAKLATEGLADAVRGESDA